jgi:hypothetical protein
MTAKEIQSLTKKGKSTVYRWIEKASQNGKLNSQNGTIKDAVDYNLNDSIEIIRAGGNDLLADLLKENSEIHINSAKKMMSVNPSNNEIYEKIMMMLELTISSNAAIIKALEINNQNNNKRLEYRQDYYSIIGYANSKGIKDITVTEARRLSLIAKNLTIESGKEVRVIPDERWGKANSYPVEILEKVFEL